MTITEKAAYLKGLAEGLGLDENAKETKMFNAIIDLLDDLALTVADTDDELGLVAEQLDAVDEDLDALETFVYEEMDDCCDCGEDYDDDELYELECPNCHEIVYFDSSIFEDEDDLQCPACGTVFDEIIEEDDDEEKDN